jgi:two-component system phosphate regulon sensor histidine kinase PhoR
MTGARYQFRPRQEFDSELLIAGYPSMYGYGWVGGICNLKFAIFNSCPCPDLRIPNSEFRIRYTLCMSRRGPLTPRHLVVAVLVVVVVNAQLTWWIIFVLGQNRARLELERQRLVDATRWETHRVAESLAAGRLALLGTLISSGGSEPPPPPEQFVSVHRSNSPLCNSGWVDDGTRLGLAVETNGGCFEAVARSVWRDRLLDMGADLEVVDYVDPGDEASTAVNLPTPYEGLVIRPRAEVWQAVLDDYRGRIAMIVSEGAIIATLLFNLIGVLGRTRRREAELERRHRNFLSAITHELKSPLAATRLALETVLSGRAEGADRDRFLDYALRDTERLQDLVQKVLQVTRYDRGGEQLGLSPACLSGIVDDAVDTFDRRVNPLGVVVEAEVEDDVWTELNEEGFTIVVSNLLENAVKYGGENPRVGVRLIVRDRRAILEVSDNGAGISEDDSKLVFDRFYRGGDEMTRTSNGTGLGLHLVKQIVQAHHGQVDLAQSGPGGSTFRVILPGAEVRGARS